MRVKRIQISRWRQFRNVELALSADSKLVCLVGANGTGKSNLLELVAACASWAGLAPGVDSPRGNVFSDEADFTVEIDLSKGLPDPVRERIGGIGGSGKWDWTLRFQRSTEGEPRQAIFAGGIEHAGDSQSLAGTIVGLVGQSQEVNFLKLDADRAYPKSEVKTGQLGEAYRTDWSSDEFTRGRSYRPSATLYEEWKRYCLAREHRQSSIMMQESRRAKRGERAPPEFVDPFDDYSASLKKVLPHLDFLGVGETKGTLLFDTSGQELTFDQLSGGEREIAFLMGQIDRFRLRRGLLLLDEPELHLNPDLIRAWVAYLASTVETGQVWLATHSLEAVEAAGPAATFVLDREPSDRMVQSIARLDGLALLNALSRAVGSPAFSISQSAFVFIEGEDRLGERERFRRISATPVSVKFIACGPCTEVERRVAAVQAIANDSATGIRVAGIIDRDFRTTEQVATLKAAGIFVLPVHEVENFFLDPRTLARLLDQGGRGDRDPVAIVRAAADSRAGSWIFQHAFSTKNATSLPAISSAAKDRAKSKPWSAFETDRASTIENIVGASGYADEHREKLGKLLDVSAKSYERHRGENDFWKVCEGKQVLEQVAAAIGFSDPPALADASIAAWERDPGSISEELGELRAVLASV